MRAVVARDSRTALRVRREVVGVKGGHWTIRLSWCRAMGCTCVQKVGFSIDRGVRLRLRTWAAISPSVATHTLSQATTSAIRPDKAAALEGRPLRKGWFVSTQQPPTVAQRLELQPPQFDAPSRGLSMSPRPGDVGQEAVLLPVVERPLDRDLDERACRVDGELVGDVGVHQAGVVEEAAVGEQCRGAPGQVPHRRAVARSVGRRRPPRGRRARGRGTRSPALGSAPVGCSCR